VSQKRALTRRLQSALVAAAATGRTTYRHADGSTLSLPDRVVIDAFLRVGEPEHPAFTPEAIAFLAESEITDSMCDMEASLIETARTSLSEAHSPNTPQPHPGPDRLPYPTPTTPQTIQVDDPNSPEGDR
jgi:hypothetical protein